MSDEKVAAAAREFARRIAEHDGEDGVTDKTPFGEGDFLHSDEQEAWIALVAAIAEEESE